MDEDLNMDEEDLEDAEDKTNKVKEENKGSLHDNTQSPNKDSNKLEE